jgi:hypothetical protein
MFAHHAAPAGEKLSRKPALRLAERKEFGATLFWQATAILFAAVISLQRFARISLLNITRRACAFSNHLRQRKRAYAKKQSGETGDSDSRSSLALGRSRITPSSNVLLAACPRTARSCRYLEHFAGQRGLDQCPADHFGIVSASPPSPWSKPM